MAEIEFIKEEFLTPTPILYTYKGHMEQSLVSNDFESAVDITWTHNINETKQLSFTIPFNENRKLDYNSVEKLVYFNGIYFIIKEIEVDSNSKDMKVSCEEISCALKNVFCENITMVGATPQAIFNAIISATKFSNIGYTWLGTDVASGVYRHLVTESETSCYENLMALAKVFDGHIEFTYDEKSGQGCVFLRTQPINTGKFITKEVELKSLTVTASSRDLFTQYYPTGKTDDYQIVLDVQAVNNGQSIIRDYSYYQSLGIPDNVILNDPLYNSLRTFNDDTYVDATDLLNVSKQELKKCAQPTFEAEVSMSDLSIYVDSPIEPPQIGMSLRCIDESIDFIFDCQIIGVERNFNNPLDTKITISNVIRYDTSQQNINHAIDVIGQVTTTDPRDTDGNVVGDGSPTIIASKVCDGDHVNVVMRNAETKSLITQTANEISLRVDAIGKSYAELKVESDKITSHVEDISDTATKTYSEIQQTATKIKAVVVQGNDGSSWELSKDAFQVAFLKSSADITTINEYGITASNEDGSYTRMGSKGLEHIDGNGSRPYHYLNKVVTKRYIQCDDDDYTTFSLAIPSMFNNIEDKTTIGVSVGIAKVYDSNSGSESVCYAFGAYASIDSPDATYMQISVMSAWRDYHTDSNDTSEWISKFDSPRGGLIDINVTLTA